MMGTGHRFTAGLALVGLGAILAFSDLPLGGPVVTVVISAAGGVLAAATGTDAWFAVVLFCGLLAWWLRPGVMSAKRQGNVA
jgi:hypothetical protein